MRRRSAQRAERRLPPASWAQQPKWSSFTSLQSIHPTSATASHTPQKQGPAPTTMNMRVFALAAVLALCASRVGK